MPLKVKKVDKKPQEGRNIGLGIPTPKKVCNDRNCPFHGNLPVRGQTFNGEIITDRMDKTAIIKRERLQYIKKYERLEKRTSKVPAHNPPCIAAKSGDLVTVVECRPLSKTVSFVIVEKIGGMER